MSTGDSISNLKGTRRIDWAEIIDDPSKPLVVDIGSGRSLAPESFYID